MQKLSKLATALIVGAMMSATAMAAGKAFVTVNGTAVSQSIADVFISEQKAKGAPDSAELKNAVREELIRRELLVQEAKKAGMDKKPDVTAQAEAARQAIYVRAYIQDYVSKHPISDDQLKADYEKIKAQLGNTEYKARHILVKSEDDAKAIIANLKKGAKFEEIAKKSSKDPGSGANGGDLDWANADSYVPEFSAAMKKLEKGQMTEVPVKTQFGWHVIRLEDVREAQLPPFDQVKPQIVQQMQQQKLAKFQDDLRAKAKVE